MKFAASVLSACILAVLASARAAQAQAQEPTPPPQADDDHRPLLRDAETADAEAVQPQTPPKIGIGTRTSPQNGGFLTEWSVGGQVEWVDALGFRTNALGTSKALMSPSWLALGPAWQFDVRASTRGPAGVQLTARAGGNGGQRLPTSANDFLGSHPAGPAFTTLDPGMRQTVWSAGLQLERGFELGHAELSVFGEALFLAGDQPGGAPPPLLNGSYDAPLRLTTGLNVKF